MSSTNLFRYMCPADYDGFEAWEIDDDIRTKMRITSLLCSGYFNIVERMVIIEGVSQLNDQMNVDFENQYFVPLIAKVSFLMCLSVKHSLFLQPCFNCNCLYHSVCQW
jgi:hypothetical protein